MTVETQTYKTQATGNSSATDFSFSPMAIFKTTDIVVTMTNLTTGVETTLTEGTGANAYSVTPSSGSYPSNTGVTGYITYPEDEVTPITSNFQITIKRTLTLEQTVDLENQGGYFPDTQEAALDKLVMIALQQQEELDRVVKAAVSDTSASLQLPTATARANKFLTFDASGNASVSSSTVGVPVSDFVLTIVDDESAAEVMTTLGITSFMQTVLDDTTAAAARTTLDVPENTDALSSIGGLTPAANKVPRYTGAAAADLLDFLDEDTMSSDSATAVASQQSIKAYVDNNTGWTYLSEVDLTNGGADDQTSLTLANDEDFAGVNEIEIMMYGGGTNTSSQPPIIRVGPTGGVVTTGYANNTTYESSTSSNEAGQTDGLYLYGSVTNQWVNTSTYSAKLVLARLKPGSNTWLAQLSANEDAAVNATHGFGTIALAGEIADILVTTPGGSALFDEGVINVRYR